MKNVRALNIMWISPCYYPAPGGGCLYQKIIGEGLEKFDDVQRIIVLTEKYPGQPDIEYGSTNKLKIMRIFPYRQGLNNKNFPFYIKYALQNIILMRIPKLVKDLEIDLVVVHSWFLIHPSIVQLVLRKVKAMGVSLIADMRDTALRSEHFIRLYNFDALICCAEKVVNHFRLDKQLVDKLHHIPVPITNVNVSDELVRKTLSKYNLESGGFIFSPSGISTAKRFPLVFDAWRVLLNSGYKLDLVVAGRIRDWENRYKKHHINGQLICTGNLDMYSIHALYKTAAVSLSPSDAFHESFSRVPIEAAYYNKPLLFPPGIPEYEVAFPPELICNSNDPTRIAEQIIKAIDQAALGGSYCMERHSPVEVANKTVTLFHKTVTGT